MPGPKFFQTIMGRKFFESDVPRLIRTLERIAKSLEAADPLAEVAAGNRKLVEPTIPPGPSFGEQFAVMEDGRIYCEACARRQGIDLCSDAVPTWDVGSTGWTAPCVCVECKLAIPVYVNGG